MAREQSVRAGKNRHFPGRKSWLREDIAEGSWPRSSCSYGRILSAPWIGEWYLSFVVRRTRYFAASGWYTPHARQWRAYSRRVIPGTERFV